MEQKPKKRRSTSRAFFDSKYKRTADGVFAVKLLAGSTYGISSLSGASFRDSLSTQIGSILTVVRWGK